MAKKRILWISDIHLSNELISDTKKAIDSFIEAIRVIDPSPDYLIITGDIALDGEMNDAYDNFKLLIIDKVKKYLQKLLY
ncbi:MAG: metallophosphoesterase [Saprospiraceae bacterium]|nr:metallophosphoesterase [Candidatus Vicinibacter affinis]